MKSQLPVSLGSGKDGTGLLRKTECLDSFSEKLAGQNDKTPIFIRVNVKHAWSHLPLRPLSYGFSRDIPVLSMLHVCYKELTSPHWISNAGCNCTRMNQPRLHESFSSKEPIWRNCHQMSPHTDAYPRFRAQFSQNDPSSINALSASVKNPFESSLRPHNYGPINQQLGETSNIEEVDSSNPLLNHNNSPTVIRNHTEHEQANLQKLKEVICCYFFDPVQLPDDCSFSHLETQLIKVLLIKKLVHDKKKSKIFYAIRNLSDRDIIRFLQVNPAINRKNIIKSNIFKRTWRVLEKRHKTNFFEYYFGEFIDHTPPEYFSIKEYRKGHCFNLADEFYCRCFVSHRFRSEFFETLHDESFRESLLRQSKHKFFNSFDYWMNETIAFLKNCEFPFERTTRMPEFKYGMSAKDFEIAPALFLRLISKE